MWKNARIDTNTTDSAAIEIVVPGGYIGMAGPCQTCAGFVIQAHALIGEAERVAVPGDDIEVMGECGVIEIVKQPHRVMADEALR